MLPSRRSTGPTAAEPDTGGGGSGAGVGVGVGGVGWLMGRRTLVALGCCRCRRGPPGTPPDPAGVPRAAAARAGPEPFGRYRRGSPPAVDAGGDPATEHQQRHPGPLGQLHPVCGVLHVGGDDVVVPAAQSSQVSSNTVSLQWRRRWRPRPARSCPGRRARFGPPVPGYLRRYGRHFAFAFG